MRGAPQTTAAASADKSGGGASTRCASAAPAYAAVKRYSGTCASVQRRCAAPRSDAKARARTCYAARGAAFTPYFSATPELPPLFSPPRYHIFIFAIAAFIFFDYYVIDTFAARAARHDDQRDVRVMRAARWRRER
jgi:hypothetical protein